MNRHLDKFLNFKSNSVQKIYTQRNLEQSKNIYKYYLRVQIIQRLIFYAVYIIIIIKEPIDQKFIGSVAINTIISIISIISHKNLNKYDYKDLIISMSFLHFCIMIFQGFYIIKNSSNYVDEQKEMFSTILFFVSIYSFIMYTIIKNFYYFIILMLFYWSPYFM